MENSQSDNELNIIYKSNNSINTINNNNNSNNNIIIISDKIYKSDYENQNITNNPKYQSWKLEMLQKYGKKGKIFECIQENLFYFVPYEDYMRNPYYQVKCPSCQNEICYFCKKSIPDALSEGSCCYKRKITCLYYQKGFRYINNNREFFYGYSKSLKLLLIPIINILFFIKEIHIAFFYDMYTKKENRNEDYLAFEDEDFYCTYYEAIIFVINIIMAFLLSIVYFLIYYYFVIFLLMFSIFDVSHKPFKFWLGIFYG